jgi:hypothetical protein
MAFSGVKDLLHPYKFIYLFMGSTSLTQNPITISIIEKNTKCGVQYTFANKEFLNGS